MILLWLACTTAHGEERFDVHQQMRDGDAESCELCHEEDESLRIEAAKTCDGCHHKTAHAGTVEHVGVEMDPEMTARAEKAGLPLREGTTDCLSCHDAHPSGTVEHRPAATKPKSTPSWWPGHKTPSSDLLRLPAEELCSLSRLF